VLCRKTSLVSFIFDASSGEVYLFRDSTLQQENSKRHGIQSNDTKIKKQRLCIQAQIWFTEIAGGAATGYYFSLSIFRSCNKAG